MRLGRAYEAQGYLTLARITYEALSQRSQDSQIVAQAEKRASRLDTEQTADAAPADSAPDSAPPESPQIAQPIPLKQPSKGPHPNTDASPPKKDDAKAKTVAQPSEAKPPAQHPPAEVKPVTRPGKTKPAPEPPKTPTPSADPSLVQQLGLSVKTIVIDPGHGGKDPGAVSQTRHEKQVVLSLSKVLARHLGQERVSCTNDA